LTTEYRILGPLEALVDGEPVELGGPRQRALLAVLLTRAGLTVSRDGLIDALWGEDPPASAANVLQTYVSHLRKVLPPARLHTRPPGYALEVGDDEIDLRRFERELADGRRLLSEGDPERALLHLDEALALWRGSPLGGIGDAPFAAVEAARLEELRLAGLEDRFDAVLALGRNSQAVPEIEAFVGEQPLRERSRAQLMLALYRSGRQSDALAAFRDFRTLLVEELGIEPGQALRDLNAAILRQDRALDLQGDTPAPRAVRTVLVVGFAKRSVDVLLALSGPIARRPPHDVILVLLVSDVRDLPAASEAANARRAALVAAGLGARAAAFTSGNPGDDIARLVADTEVSLLLIDAVGRLGRDGRFDPLLAGLLESVPCDVGLLVHSKGATGTGDSPVLVPFGGAEHEWAAVELGAWIASAEERPLRLAGVEADLAAGRRDASRLLARAALLVQQVTGVSTEPVLLAPGPDQLAAETGHSRIAVLGLPDGWRTRGVGQTRAELAARASAPLLFVRGGPKPGGLAPDESHTRFTWTIGGSPG
jgi:DNA-binding SARP family transcriptional activator